jgi:hypothetical protein
MGGGGWHLHAHGPHPSQWLQLLVMVLLTLLNALHGWQHATAILCAVARQYNVARPTHRCIQTAAAVGCRWGSLGVWCR